MVDYQAALPIGVAIGVAIVAFAYMLSQLIQSEPLKAYAKIELGELVLSTILVLICVAAFASVPTFLASALNLSPNTYSFGVPQAGQALHDSLEVPLQSALDALVQDSFRMTKIIGYNYNGQVAVPYISGIFSSAPGAGASPIMLQLQTGMDTTSLTLLLVRAVRIGALFLDWAVQFLLMPLGIILRFIPPCRKVGGLILGISLAIHLAFPAAVGFSLEMGSQFFPHTSVYVMPDPGNVALKGLVCSPVMQGMYTAGEVLAPTIVAYLACSGAAIGGPAAYAACVGKAGDPALVDPSAFGVSGILSSLWYLFDLGFQGVSSVLLLTAPVNMSPGQIGAIYQQLATQVLPVVVDLNLSVLMLIVIQLAATIVLAREFAMVMGGEGQFYGLAKLV